MTGIVREPQQLVDIDYVINRIVGVSFNQV